MINYVKNRAVAAAGLIIEGLNNSSDTESLSNKECDNEEVGYCLIKVVVSVLSCLNGGCWRL